MRRDDDNCLLTSHQSALGNMWFRRATNIFIIFLLITPILAWDNEELELFDLVEDVNANFYDVLGVEQSTSSADIRRAYRKLSVKLHPDKNKEEGAEENFRKLVAVYEVLKDEQRRLKYNDILVNGLPDWRTPVYYYRKARKLGLVELAIMLFTIVTIGHFVVIWSMYLERRFEMEEVFTSKKKREKKGKKAKAVEKENEVIDEVLQEHLNTLHRPTILDLIPCKLVTGTITTLLYLPTYVEEFKRWREERRMLAEQSAEEESEEEVGEEKVKKPKRRQRIEVPEFQPEMATDVAPVVNIAERKEISEEKREDRSGMSWNDHEISLLAKAVSKFPSGTVDRWEKIADFVGRSVSEVTSKSKEIKNRVTMTVDHASQGVTGAITEKLTFKKGRTLNSDISERQWSASNSSSDINAKADPPPEPESSVPAATVNVTEKIPEVDKTWTQAQQKALEIALSQYPKGTPERWEKVSGHITGKTKEECIARFKYLADCIRKRKLEAEIANR